MPRYRAKIRQVWVVEVELLAPDLEATRRMAIDSGGAGAGAGGVRVDPGRRGDGDRARRRASARLGRVAFGGGDLAEVAGQVPKEAVGAGRSHAPGHRIACGGRGVDRGDQLREGGGADPRGALGLALPVGPLARGMGLAPAPPRSRASSAAPSQPPPQEVFVRVIKTSWRAGGRQRKRPPVGGRTASILSCPPRVPQDPCRSLPTE